MSYERQISPTSIDELSSLPGLNCDATLGFVGLTATDMHPNEHNIIHHNDGKHLWITPSITSILFVSPAIHYNILTVNNLYTAIS